MAQFLTGAGYVVMYFVIAASVAIACRLLIKIPDEIFRKTLHGILLGSLLVFVYGFPNWKLAVLAALAFAVVVYPILLLLERIDTFSEITTERKKGELKTSLLLVFTMFAVVIAICWGWLSDRYLVLASVYAWGFGDAAAALIGKSFGKHKVNWKGVDNKKSVEGSASMFVTSFACVAVILWCRGGMGILTGFIVAFTTALVSTFAELYSKNGMDTVICPISAMTVLILLLQALGGWV